MASLFHNISIYKFMPNDTEKKVTNANNFIGQVVNVTVDRPLNSKHPKFDWLYPLNYGFVAGTCSADGEEIDAYIIGANEPVESFVGQCIAVIHRTDDDDDKLVVVQDGSKLADEEIRKATHFQEQYFKSVIFRSNK